MLWSCVTDASRRRTRWSRGLGVLGLGLACAGNACSLLYELNTTQCEFPEDCQALGPQFARTTCVNRVCVADPDQAGTGGQGGASGAGGASGGRGGSEAGAGATGGNAGGAGKAGTGGEGGGGPECETNSQCIDANVQQPFICQDGRCVKVTTTSCPLLLPSMKLDYLREDGVLLMGGFASFTNTADPHDTLAAINWDLALTEFNDSTFEGALIDQPARPIVMVVCNGLEPDVTPSVEHLVRSLEVPGILSTLTAQQLYTAYQATAGFVEDDDLPPTFFMSTGSADLRLAELQDDGLVWHMLGDPRTLAETAAQLVARMEPVVNAARLANFQSGGSDDPMQVPLRVTLVTSEHPTLTDIGNVLTKTDSQRPERMLMFNGKSSSANGDDFQWVRIRPSQSNPNVMDTAAALTEIQSAPPHVIVAQTTDVFATGVLAALERNWDDNEAAEGLPRPYYVFSHVVSSSLSLATTLNALVDLTPRVEARALGVNYAQAQDARSQDLYRDYLARLQNSYDKDGALYDQLGGTENFYDGAYSLLYSLAFAAGFRPLPDGLNVRDALEQRVFSTSSNAIETDIGPDSVGAAIGAARPISLWGTMGAPNFDRLSGTRETQTSVWCLQVEEETASTYQHDALVYDRGSRTFRQGVGTPPACIAGY